MAAKQLIDAHVFLDTFYSVGGSVPESNPRLIQQIYISRTRDAAYESYIRTSIANSSAMRLRTPYHVSF